MAMNVSETTSKRVNLTSFIRFSRQAGWIAHYKAWDRGVFFELTTRSKKIFTPRLSPRSGGATLGNRLRSRDLHPCVIVSTIPSHDAATCGFWRCSSVVPRLDSLKVKANDNFDQIAEARAQRHALDRQTKSR